MQKKHFLYMIGGPARVGKSIVAMKVMSKKRLLVISTDAIRAAIRKVLLGESRISVEKIRFAVHATFRRPGSLKKHVVHRAQRSKSEDELVWAGVLGLIEAYDRKDIADVLVEGIAATPERVHRLKLKNLRLKAVFIGYNERSHAASILAYSKQTRDWVHTWIKEHGGDESLVHNWVKRGIVKNKSLKRSAERFGYRYFDISKKPFERNIEAAAHYLLK